jgi:hypothetical protein
MKEPSEYEDYKKKNHPQEEMKSWEPVRFENRPTKWDDFVDWFDVEHRLTRGQVIFIGATICYIASPEFGKFIVQSGVPAFLKYYGAAILAGIALFMLTRSDRS